MSGRRGQHRALPPAGPARRARRTGRLGRLALTLTIVFTALLSGGTLMFGASGFAGALVVGGALVTAAWHRLARTPGEEVRNAHADDAATAGADAAGPGAGGRNMSGRNMSDRGAGGGSGPYEQGRSPLPAQEADRSGGTGRTPSRDLVLRAPRPEFRPDGSSTGGSAHPEAEGPGSASGPARRPEPAPRPHPGTSPDTGIGAPAGPEPVPHERPRTEIEGFPVLATPSRAFHASWLLPEQPAPHGLVADRAELGGLVLRAASVIGPGHRALARPRQDAYRIGRDRSGDHLIVAVADGMSDSPHSDIGAQVAVSALVGAVREALDSGTDPESLARVQVFLAAAKQMYAAADARGWTADDVRAVAAVAVIPAAAEPGTARRVWLGAIADATAWRLEKGAWDRLIGDGKSGYDPSSVSSFLPHTPDLATYETVELRSGSALAVTTDGVGDALESGPTAREWFADRWAGPPEVGRFLMDVGFEQVQMQDDRTAVVVWCADEETA
ncbi:protein phosphatase 2C domain-containing protein [Streptomyces sp. NBC_01298]|uniref:protein phosphatase 2C domain-containing protein n=1 Tax=Streptomyces sp. NBC_01298 TaxID=2903817 RepID=UPI002E11E5EB|nr:protein phosphatase 2C domain-containing protein [Streptomyces sp. NBC_01298]